MLFNSYIFILAFLPLALLGWWKVFRTPRQRLAFLTIASYVFYSAFDFPMGVKLLPLLLFSTMVDWVAGRRIHAAASEVARKRWLVASLVANLGMLATFKYLGFFETTINGLLALVGHPTGVPVHDIILPIGISFYTFQSMSYTIDIYRRKLEPARDIVEYAAFVSLFPQLVAGPIVRYSDIETQLRALKQRMTTRMAAIGVFFFTAGLFKKLVIADSVAPTVDRLWAASGDLTMVSAWAAALGYSMQLYFDFSAYSDMAIGLAMLFGFRFPQNFNSPYKAVNISDFWRRWHMTLSRFLRDYLYIPLGGNRTTRAKTLRNLMIVMFLGGLWHGAGWTFAIWGVGHGLALIIHQVAVRRGWTPGSVLVNRALTFLVVVLLWVPFRSPDFATTGEVIAAMFGMNGIGFAHLTAGVSATGTQVSAAFIGMLATLIAFVNLAPNTFEVRLRPTRLRAAGAGVAFATSLMLLAAPSPFLYFQF